MSMPSRQAVRRLWFQVHLWIGVALSAVLIPLSLTGSLLVWHEPLERLTAPQRYRVTGEAGRPLQDYATAARTVLKPDEPIAQIRLPEHQAAPILVSAPMSRKGAAPVRGRAPQHTVWIDPGSARVLDQASSAAGVQRALHQLHGTLFIPGVGRKVVGWLGWLMLVSCLTGVWIWWPRNGKVLKGFSWRRSSLFTGNLHHQVGVWIAVPLAVLSFTGAYISFPQTMRALTGGHQVERAAGPGERGEGRRADRGGQRRE
ncbi:MAG: PepSY domain-containing protein, partial [Caulobacteraceae bacterium]|nr:PepSY domain-containing protein [Caulobacteraceae bacterium]